MQSSRRYNQSFRTKWHKSGAEISYAGFNAFERAKLAAQILRERLSDLNIRIDFIGATSIFAGDAGDGPSYVYASSLEDIRLRVAVAHDDRNQVIKVCREVTALYTCGPVGGGGVRTNLKPRLNTISCFIPRELIASTYTFFEG